MPSQRFSMIVIILVALSLLQWINQTENQQFVYASQNHVTLFRNNVTLPHQPVSSFD